MGKLLKNLLLILVSVYVIVSSIIWLFSPLAARHFINNYLTKEHDLVLSQQTTIRFNPFIAHLSISDLALSPSTAPENSVLTIEQASIKIALYKLLSKTVYVSEFFIDGLGLSVTQQKELLTVAGVQLPLTPTEETAEVTPEPGESTEPSEFSVAIPHFTFTDSEITLNINDNLHRFALNKLQIDKLVASASEQSLVLSLMSSLDEGIINIEGEVVANQAQQNVNVELNTKQLTLAPFQHFLASAGINQLTGELNYQIQANITNNNKGLNVSANNSALLLNNFSMKNDDFLVSAQKQHLVNKAMTLSLTKENVLTVSTNTSLNLSGINLELAEQGKIKTDQITYQVDANLTKNINDLSLNMLNGELAVNKLAVEQKDLRISINEQVLEHNNTRLTLINNQPDVIKTQSKYHANNFLVTTANVQNKVASFAELNINNVVFEMLQQQPSVSIEKIELTDIVGSDNLADNIAPLATLDNVSVKAIKATAKSADIERITVTSLLANLEVNTEKKLATLVEFPKSEPTVNASESASGNNNVAQQSESSLPLTESTSEPFHFSIGEFTFLTPAYIKFKDESVKPTFIRNVELNTFVISPINNNKPEQFINAHIAGKTDKYSTFELKANTTAFAQQPTHKINGNIKELTLPSLSPYVKGALHHEIKSGQLDIHVDADVVNDIIDGDLKVVLRGIELNAADDHEEGSIKDKTSMPLNLALGVLKDSNDNVKLTLPLSGDINSPSFGVSGIIGLLVKQATKSAAKEYVISTFLPYNTIMKVAIMAGQEALKMSFNDLEFTPGNTELQPEHQEFLTNFGALLRDKKDLQIKLCAVSIPEDIGLKNGETVTEHDDILALNEISQQRIDNFKSYLVDKEQVTSSRLLLCAPKISNNKDAKPALKFVN